ncbi:riboflavin synthase subunit alpha [Fusobacterium pseudoperiodonticum]|uniref:Riboflavin synthase subunit alpha n=1 Tax=Fusobacterium pseudoperiodonticum TaxID=2663009 RepID=A0AAD0API3_9FUSO|nr:riboflavin synthase subunit alpha [Fusobacterium pseudoperiodonticum]ATV60527.1 riboflavin synthase subunit alpha [Fusobacterium pseudoperiodonticum]
MSRVILGVSEANLLASFPKLQRILDFLSLRNLASNELLAYTYIFKESETCKNSLKDLILEK